MSLAVAAKPFAQNTVPIGALTTPRTVVYGFDVPGWSNSLKSPTRILAVGTLTNPKSPAVLASGVITLPGVSGAAYTQLIPYGANQLVAVSTSAAHAVVIIDRTNPTSLTKVAETSLPATLDLFKARIVSGVNKSARA